MHLMIDFETLDTAPSTIVVSAGITLFHTDRIIDSMYCELDITSQVELGRTFSEDTLRWWFSQSKEAQKPLLPKNQAEKENLHSLKLFLLNLNQWVEARMKEEKTNWKGLNIWSNGANFDEPILANLYRSCGMKIPYMFWNVRCYRTFDAMTKCRSLVQRQGTHHNAMDDAIYQAETVIAYYEKRKKRK